MYKVVITEPAEEDIKAAVVYISKELKNNHAALRLLDDMQEAIGSLSSMPKRCPLVKDEALALEGIRFITVKNYMMFYTVREQTNTVVILRFLYAKRDWQHIL